MSFPKRATEKENVERIRAILKVMDHTGEALDPTFRDILLAQFRYETGYVPTEREIRKALGRKRNG